jgi:hypothetical protein
MAYLFTNPGRVLRDGLDFESPFEALFSALAG